MSGTGSIGLMLIIANFIFSYQGFRNPAFLDRYKFQVEKILLYREYKRLVSSGFLHVNWIHLIFNMISLLLFSGLVEDYLGAVRFLLVYFASLVGGNLVSLLIHRHHSDYSSVGASGAVCGVIFASIALFPNIHISFFFFPVSMPAWIYGIGYVLYTIYGIRSQMDNVGHDAHLGGALVGMTTGLLFEPASFADNYLTILLIAVPAIAFIIIIVLRPHTLLIDNLFFKNNQHHYSIDHKYNEEKVIRQKEIDRILDKIAARGMNSITQKEKETLKDYSKGR